MRREDETHFILNLFFSIFTLVMRKKTKPDQSIGYRLNGILWKVFTWKNVRVEKNQIESIFVSDSCWSRTFHGIWAQFHWVWDLINWSLRYLGFSFTILTRYDNNFVKFSVLSDSSHIKYFVKKIEIPSNFNLPEFGPCNGIIIISLSYTDMRQNVKHRFAF